MTSIGKAAIGLFALAIGAGLFSAKAVAQTANWPNVQEADFIAKDFEFSGEAEKLAELRIHYTTFGTPKRNAAGEITNGVLLLQGRGGEGKAWFTPSLANELYGPGQALDASQYFIILPDNLGRGGSSRPSNGLKSKFPHYDLRDLVKAEHALVADGLGIKRLSLVMGSSLGGMQTWLWGTMYPDAMDALAPFASMPIAMSGRNWLLRRVTIEAIRNDPGWNGGDYETNPSNFIHTAPAEALWTDSPISFQQIAPTVAAGDKWYNQAVEQLRKEDANDLLWASESAMNFDPSGDLERIKARVLIVNSADDEVNPPDLGVIEPALKRIAQARYVLVPGSAQTHGHFTHRQAALWKDELLSFMRERP